MYDRGWELRREYNSDGINDRAYLSVRSRCLENIILVDVPCFWHQILFRNSNARGACHWTDQRQSGNSQYITDENSPLLYARRSSYIHKQLRSLVSKRFVYNNYNNNVCRSVNVLRCFVNYYHVGIIFNRTVFTFS